VSEVLGVFLGMMKIFCKQIAMMAVMNCTLKSTVNPCQQEKKVLMYHSGKMPEAELCI
jgi:hypothetical protein